MIFFRVNFVSLQNKYLFYLKSAANFLGDVNYFFIVRAGRK